MSNCSQNTALSKQLQAEHQALISDLLQDETFREQLREKLKATLLNTSLYDREADCSTSIDPDKVRLTTPDVDKAYYFIEPNYFPLPTVGDPLNAISGLLLSYVQNWRHQCFGLGGLIYSITLLPGEELELEYKTYDSIRRAQAEESGETENILKSYEEHTTNTEDIVDATVKRTTDETVDQLNMGISGELASQIDPVAVGSMAAGASPLTGLVSGGGSNYIRPKINGGIQNTNTHRVVEDTIDEDRTTTKDLEEKTRKSSSEVSKYNSVKIDIASEQRRETSQVRRIKNINQCHAVSYNHFQLKKYFDVSTFVDTVKISLFGENLNLQEVTSNAIAGFSGNVVQRLWARIELEFSNLKNKIILLSTFQQFAQNYKNLYQNILNIFNDSLREELKKQGAASLEAIISRFFLGFLPELYENWHNEGKKPGMDGAPTIEDEFNNIYHSFHAEVGQFYQNWPGEKVFVEPFFIGTIRDYLKTEIQKGLFKALKIQEFDAFSIGVSKCWKSGFARYFQPDIEASHKLLRPVWISNATLGRLQLAGSSDPDKIIKESALYETFEFVVSKMPKKNLDLLGLNTMQILENFVAMVRTYLTGMPDMSVQQVNTSGVYVESTQSRCTACEPYYVRMRNLEADEKALNNEQLALINEGKLPLPDAETPADKKIAVDVDISGKGNL